MESDFGSPKQRWTVHINHTIPTGYLLYLNLSGIDHVPSYNTIAFSKFILGGNLPMLYMSPFNISHKKIN